MTLNGFLISKSGNMTGGTTARDLDRAGQWDAKEFAELKVRREELGQEKETLSREHRNRSLKVRRRLFFLGEGGGSFFRFRVMGWLKC